MGKQFNPPSWHVNGVPDTTLADFNDVVGSVPKINGVEAKLYMEEVTADEGDQRQCRLSNNQTSAANMSYWMPDYCMSNTEIQRVVTKTILGGWFGAEVGGNDKKNPPMPNPLINNIQSTGGVGSGAGFAGCKGMFAKDIIGWRSVSPREWNNSPVNQGGDPLTMRRSANYNTCMMGISFESLPYTVNETPSPGPGSINYNWLEVQVKATNSRVSLPLGVYVYKNFPPAGVVPAMLGNWKVLPQSFIQIIVHQVPRKFFFGNNTNMQPSVLYSSATGRINNAPFAGMNAGTLMINDYETFEYNDWLGQRMIELKINCIYNEIGWNRQFTPAGGLDDVIGANGGAPPFLNMNMTAIIAGVNPL